MEDGFFRNIVIKRTIARWYSYNILKHSSLETKKIFRCLERIQVKITKKQMDIIFNQKCLDNGLLPNYSD